MHVKNAISDLLMRQGVAINSFNLLTFFCFWGTPILVNGPNFPADCCNLSNNITLLLLNSAMHGVNALKMLRIDAGEIG